MGRRKGAAWGNKAPKTSSTRKEQASHRPEPNKAQIDWGELYDKLSTRGAARGKSVDDLVLLDNVSNEGIVEVSKCPRLSESYLPGRGRALLCMCV